jgi:hypothetical protein
VRSMVSTKSFRNGGSVGAGTPAGWLDSDKGVGLVRDDKTERIYIRQVQLDIDDFLISCKTRTECQSRP